MQTPLLPRACLLLLAAGARPQLLQGRARTPSAAAAAARSASAPRRAPIQTRCTPPTSAATPSSAATDTDNMASNSNGGRPQPTTAGTPQGDAAASVVVVRGGGGGGGVYAFETSVLQQLTIPNVRDLNEAHPEITPGRVVRCACPIPAKGEDVRLILEELRITRMIDLRSDDERKEDRGAEVLRGARVVRYERIGSEVMSWDEANFTWPTNTLGPDPAASEKRLNRPSAAAAAASFSSSTAAAAAKAESSSSPGRRQEQQRQQQQPPQGRGAGTASSSSRGASSSAGAGGGLQGTSGERQAQQGRLEVHQLGLLSKTRYFRGLVWRLSFTTMGSVALWSLLDPGKSKRLLIDRINEGGLDLLYEIILETAKPEIFKVLKLMTTSLEDGHRVVLFCKVGKDRTGIVAALALLSAGASREAVVADYHRSDEYHAVGLGGLEKDSRLAGLDLKKFSRAPADVIVRALAWVDARYGSHDAYLNDIGFDQAWRNRLAAALKGRPLASVTQMSSGTAGEQ